MLKFIEFFPSFAVGAGWEGHKGPGPRGEPPGPLPIGYDVMELMRNGMPQLQRLGVLIDTRSDVDIWVEIDSMGKSLYRSPSIPVFGSNGMARMYALESWAAELLAKYYVPGNTFKVFVYGANAGECSVAIMALKN